MRQPGRCASAPVVLEAQSVSGAVDISIIRQRMMTRYAFHNIRAILFQCPCKLNDSKPTLSRKQEASQAQYGCKYQLSALKISTLYFDISCPHV